jgi:hypothetical protein
MNEPALSLEFTVDDIHKLRKFNNDRRKDMTFEEYKADLQNEASEVIETIDRLRMERRMLAQ